MRQPALSSLLVRVRRQNVKHDLNYTKWVLLVFVILELVSLLIAFVMRCCVDPDGHYGNFEDEEVGMRKRSHRAHAHCKHTRSHQPSMFSSLGP